MDPASLSLGAIGLAVQLGTTVVQLKRVIDAWRGAPQSLHYLHLRTVSAQTNFEQSGEILGRRGRQNFWLQAREQPLLVNLSNHLRQGNTIVADILALLSRHGGDFATMGAIWDRLWNKDDFNDPDSRMYQLVQSMTQVHENITLAHRHHLSEQDALRDSIGEINADTQIGDDRHPLHQAAGIGNVFEIQYQLQVLNQTQWIDVNAVTTLGCTPLHVAAMRGKVDAMQELIKHGATVDLYSYAPSALTALHCAIERGQAEAARILLLNGASSMAANGRSDTPLDVCLNNIRYTQTWTPHHQETIVRTLMDYHAELNTTTYRTLDALPSLITHPYDHYLTDSVPVLQNRLFALLTRQPAGSTIQQARVIYDYTPQPPALGVHTLTCFDTVYYLATSHAQVLAKNAWILAWKLGESRLVYTSYIQPRT